MQTVGTQFEHELKKIIAEEIQRISGILALGAAVPDYLEYRFLVGQILALTKVADSYCDEAQTKINKR